jgi:hypothetical protein
MNNHPDLHSSPVAAEQPTSILIVDVPAMCTRLRLEGDDSVRFGRDPDLELCLGQHLSTMSRHVGSLYRGTGDWWVDNPPVAPGVRGCIIDLIAATGTREPVLPGHAARLRNEGRLYFPPKDFEIRFRVISADEPLDQGEAEGEGTVGTEWAVPLSPRQVDYVVALAEPELRDVPGARRRHLPQIATLWGVSPAAVETSLRILRARLVKHGLLDADEDGRPGVNDTVARIAVRHRLVTVADLEWARLDGLNNPRPASSGPRFAS